MTIDIKFHNLEMIPGKTLTEGFNLDGSNCEVRLYIFIDFFAYLSEVN